MNSAFLYAGLAMVTTLAGPLGRVAAADAVAPDDATIFTAAGFQRSAAGHYVLCNEDPPTLSYQPGSIRFDDLDGDGVPEAWVTEGSVFCYGSTGQYFVLLTRRGETWHRLLDAVGVPQVLPSRQGGWPDIEVGGPGLGSFPVYRWNGVEYRPR